MLQRKMPELGLELGVNHFGPRVAPQRFAAVGIVDRRGRAEVVGSAAVAVQREPDGRSDRAVAVVEDVPNLRTVDAVVPGGPHFDAPLVAPVEAVGHHAVLAGQLAGHHVGLHRAGDGGKAGHERRVAAAQGEPAQIRHRRQVPLAQAGNREQDDVLMHRDFG